MPDTRGMANGRAAGTLARPFRAQLPGTGTARSGDTAAALTLQRGITIALRRQPAAWHLRTVNLLNLARIHRIHGTLVQAHAAYRAWERLIEGSCTEVELFYRNFCLARDAEARNNPAERFRRWMRTALHWAANPAPECLGWRAASAVLGRFTLSVDVDAICCAVASALRDAARAFGVRPQRAATAATFAYLHPTSDCRPLEALSGPGFGLLASTRSQQAVYDTLAHSRLRGLLSGLLLATIGERAASETYYVDAALGYEMPVTPREVFDSAAWHDAASIVSRSGVRSFGGEARRQREKAAWVELSAAVDRVVEHGRSATVHFKRRWSNVELGATEALALTRIGTGKPLDVYTRRSELPLRTLRTLESLCVLRIRSRPRA